MQVLDFMVFAENHQFLVQDAETDETVAIHWEPDDEQKMVQSGVEVLSIMTARELDVCVRLEILDAEPPSLEDSSELEEWDQIVECNVSLPSGKLMIAGTSESLYDAQRLTLPESGDYGVRVFFGNLADVDEEGFEGEDMYHICLWKIGKDDDVPEFAVLKQWAPYRRFADLPYGDYDEPGDHDRDDE